MSLGHVQLHLELARFRFGSVSFALVASIGGRVENGCVNYAFAYLRPPRVDR